FSESQDGANGVYGQIFDPQGNKSSSEIRINPLTDCLGAPKIAGLSNNTFIVIYQTTPATIKGQLLDHLGNKIGAELELISFEEGITNLNPAVTGLKNGGFILAWVCLNEQMVAFKELNGHAYENSGQKIGSSFSIEQIGSLFQIGGMPKDPVPEICPLTNGGFAVTWNNDKYQFPNSDPYPFLQIGNGILVKMYSANLIPHEGSLLLNSSPAAYQTPSQISALSEGGCVVTWQEGERVRAQMVSDDGHKISGDITINMYSSEFHRSESVRALPNGRFLAVWTSSDNYHDGLFAQLYAGNGYRIGDSFQVNTFGSPHPVLSAASASDGNRMFMVWTSDGKDGDSHGIFAKTLHLIDADADADGIMDMIEAVSCSDMLNKDSDNDGIDDGDEDANKNGYRDMGETNPCSADSDSDGLSDGVEDANQNGIVDQGETDPNNSDTDSDEMSDGYEIVKGLDPLSNDAFLDKDKDGYSNLREKNAMTAPDNEYSIPEIWADFDGYFDYTSPADCDGKDLYIMMKAIAANIDTQSPSGDSTSGGDIIIINPSERSCDYNYDGKVDAVDLIFFCEDFGRGGPL
ncbi:MAG: hypothetical protein KKH99_00010, partial [Proteobacteria bacterium]|nr:hypothetical protein [Pseudomonadota bacterium]